MIVHHTDGEREYAYDKAPKSSGKLVEALADAPARGWVVMNMKDDWKEVWTEAANAQDQGPQVDLTGNWLAEDIAGGGVIDNAQSTLEIGKDGSVSGSTAVNRYSGKAKIEGEKIEFGPLATTRRAGPPALMDQESKFTKALEKAARFRIEDSGLLYLMDETGKDIVRFAKLLK
jgi:heat shock protein HslJ